MEQTVYRCGLSFDVLSKTEHTGSMLLQESLFHTPRRVSMASPNPRRTCPGGLCRPLVLVLKPLLVRLCRGGTERLGSLRWRSQWWRWRKTESSRPPGSRSSSRRSSSVQVHLTWPA